MSVYKDTKTNTWRAVFRYTDWTGERKQSQKRGFSTQREAKAWEKEQLTKLQGACNMTFGSFVDLYFEAVEIADRMGHESIDITYHYAHMFPSRQDEMASRLESERSEIICR